jgi:hypothetical protein
MLLRARYIHFDVISIPQWTHYRNYSFLIEPSILSQATYIYFVVQSVLERISVINYSFFM